VDLLQKDNLSAMRGAIIELQDDALQEVYNNFIQIPVCAALVVDLHINPNQLDDCALQVSASSSTQITSRLPVSLSTSVHLMSRPPFLARGPVQ
jgi:hypothetical protein